ncbi:hypothetical protein LAL4801_01039 [Roseibium aggregatum]|uniref:Uncharacterized protein n=1 Tax=Roseibium aggregatum TaxID=187304 RepID=A0A0M6XZZ4_9HYPH|nr:hypothetical protein LAL4801_01039 [Roseibium aggregatum]
MPGLRLLPVECFGVEFNKHDAMEGSAGRPRLELRCKRSRRPVIAKTKGPEICAGAATSRSLFDGYSFCPLLNARYHSRPALRKLSRSVMTFA